MNESARVGIIVAIASAALGLACFGAACSSEENGAPSGSTSGGDGGSTSVGGMGGSGDTGGNTGTWSGGAYGTALVLAPARVEKDEGKPVMRYVIPEAKAGEDDRVTLHSARVGNWEAQWLSQMGIQVDHLESSGDVVRGKLSWSGDPPASAWSAEFVLLLEKGVL